MKLVKCVNNCNGENFLTIGKVYEVVRDDGTWYGVNNDKGWEGYYCKDHFEDAVEQPNCELKVPFKVKCINSTNAEYELVEGETYTVSGYNGFGDYFLRECNCSWEKRRFEVVSDETVVKDGEQPTRNKYMREVKPGVWCDVYDILRAWEVTDPCLQHLLKKALASGQRGHKDLKEDLDDILASAKRAVELHEEWDNAKLPKNAFDPISSS